MNCDFSQKEFLLFRKKYYVTFGRINKTELQNVIFIMAKKSFRDIIINVLGLLFFFPFLEWLQDILGGYLRCFYLCI